MKITDIYVSGYGSLKDKKISFSDSVNIIEGVNESGKSTLMAFISFMLYGGSDDIERIRMTDGSCGGTMTLVSKKHGAMKIQRYATVNGKRYSDTAQLFLLPSMQEITPTTTIGEYVLGIGKQFFCETAFVSQRGASEYNPKNVNDSIQNILLSAAESYNTDKALKKLDETRKFFMHKRGRGGVIADLEDKKSELISNAEKNLDNIRLADSIRSDTEELRDTKNRYEELIADIYKEKKARFAKKIKDAESELNSQRLAFEQKKKELSQLCERCNEFSVENTKSRIRELDLKLKYDDAKIIDIENDILRNKRISVTDNLTEYSPEACEKLVSSIYERRKRSKSLKYAAYMTATLSVICLAFALISAIRSDIVFALFGTILTFASVCSCFFSLYAKKKSEGELSDILSKHNYPPTVSISDIRTDFAKKSAERKEEENRLKLISEKKELLRNIKARRAITSEELDSVISKTVGDAYDHKSTTAERAEEYIDAHFIKLENIKNEISVLSERIEKLTAFISSSDNSFDLLTDVDPKYSKYSDTELDTVSGKASAEINLISEKILEKEKKLSVLQTEISSPEEYETLIKDVEITLDARREQLNIVKLSEESVKYASENIRSAITPHLLAQGDRLFSAITNERYSGIGFTDDLSPSLANGETVKKRSELSHGTNEAMYLAFRSALLLTLCKNDLPPMMLDESFAHVDDPRTLECIKVLSESGIQSLIFTCNDREKRIMTESDHAFSHILI